MKQSFDKDFLGYDLFYQLSYMSSIAAAGLPRSQIFEFASQLPCISSRYFAEIHAVASEMRYDYSVACRMVGEATENDLVRSLLLRLSSSMGSGESEAAFLDEEARIQAESYRNEYERAVETLRMWTEAYAALIVAASLVVIVAAISMIIYPVATSFTVILVGVTICVAVAGAWAIHRVSPKEQRVHTPPSHCAAQARVGRLDGSGRPGVSRGSGRCRLRPPDNEEGRGHLHLPQVAGERGNRHRHNGVACGGEARSPGDGPPVT